MPEIIKTTPNIPIRLPTNSIVDTTPSASGAIASAMKAPKITIGNPTPKIIAFEVIMKNETEIYMKFMLTLVQFSLLLLIVDLLIAVLN